MSGQVTDYIEPLTEREANVLHCLADGLSNNEIAARLFLASSTIKWYVRQLNSKLNTANRDEIVERAHSLGLLDKSQPELALLKSNLPHATTPFIGRESELDAVHDLLAGPDTRLLTILAPGGMGKTRLALEAAEQQLSNFPSGVYFVPLQSLSGAEHILSQIATSTGYQFTSDGREAKQQILDYLANKQMLLLLDNFEHLLDGAPLLSDILQAAPDVKLLVTTREKLSLSMETVYGLGGMAYPSWETPEDALEYDAVQLLVSAAGRVNPDWEVSAENLDYVARVCRLTQGMPLGILLAASWLDVFLLERICEEIQKSADILETELRDVPERQRSIRAVFEYAWRGLKPAEQGVFMRMSVFHGGCSPRAAETITGANPRLLQVLVNKALLVRNREGRYDIHELLRQYAEEQLVQTGTAETTRDAHMNYYAEALYECEAQLKDHRQLDALRDITEDFENARAAWRWALRQGHDNAIDHMVSALGWYTWISARFYDSIDLFTQAIAVLTQQPEATDKDWGAKARLFHGSLLRLFGKFEAARPMLEASLEKLRQSGSLEEIALCLGRLSLTLADEGKLIEALQLAQESLSVASKTGDPWSIAFAHCHISMVYNGMANMKCSHSYALQSLELFSKIGNTYGMVVAYLWCDFAGRFLGYAEEAHLHYLQAYHLASALGNKFNSAIALANLTYWPNLKGDWEEAERLYREALALIRETGLSDETIIPLSGLILLLLNCGRAEEAEQLLEEAQSMNIRNTTAQFTRLLRARSSIAALHGAYEEAHRLAQEAYARAREKSNAYDIAYSNGVLGWALCGIGQYDDAVTHVMFALEFALRIGYLPEILTCVAALAQIEAHRGQSECAAELLGMVFEHPVQIAWLGQHGRVVELRQHLKTELGEDAYSAAWERGSSLELEVVARKLLDTFSKET